MPVATQTKIILKDRDKEFTFKLIWKKIPPTQYVATKMIIYMYFYSHNLFNELYDLVK